MGLRDLLFKRGYEEALEGESDADKELAKRLEKYGTICQLGIANLFWKGTTLVSKDMKAKEDPLLVYYITIFTVCLLLMAMGTVASQFPDTSPFPCFTSGVGALVAILSMFGSYHLDLMEYFPSPYDCSASMILMGLAFTLYWAYAVQDPWVSLKSFCCIDFCACLL